MCTALETNDVLSGVVQIDIRRERERERVEFQCDSNRSQVDSACFSAACCSGITTVCLISDRAAEFSSPRLSTWMRTVGPTGYSGRESVDPAGRG